MNKERKPCEQALDTFHQELRKAILNEEIPMTFEPDIYPYFATVTFRLCSDTGRMAVTEDYVCYLTPFISGLFDTDTPEFEQFKAIIKKHVKVLTEEDRVKLAELQSEIDRIKGVKQ